jgi:hypothetical protein
MAGADPDTPPAGRSSLRPKPFREAARYRRAAFFCSGAVLFGDSLEAEAATRCAAWRLAVVS